MANYNEPKYDTDQVNYGFLKKTLNLTKEENDKEIIQYAKNYSSPPNPPYYEGWTYTQNNKIYRCIKDRLIGSFSIADWVLIYDHNRQNAMLKSFLLLSELELSEQSDGEIETFYQDDNPSLEWDTTIIKSQHEGDYWRVNENGIYKNYMYVKHTDNPVSYIWEQVDVPISIFDTTNGKKKIYTKRPTSYKKDDLWKLKEEDLVLFPELGLNVGDYVTTVSDSLSFDPNHWCKKEDELSVKSLDTYYYTTIEINKIIDIINKNIQAEILKGDDFIKAFVKEEYTTKETTNTITQKVDSNGRVIEQILGESTSETPTLNLAQLSLLSKQINIELTKKVNDVDLTGARIMLEINNDVSGAKINADRILLNANDILNLIAGNELNLSTKNLSIVADNFSVDATGTMVCTAAKIIDAIINNATMNNVIIQGENSKINIQTNRTMEDAIIIKGIFGSLPTEIKIGNYMSKYTVYDNDGSVLTETTISAGKISTPKLEAKNIDSGRCVLTASGERTINFNKTFTSEPNIVLTPITVTNGVIAAKITGISTTYFKATIGGTSFGDTEFAWIAMTN